MLRKCSIALLMMAANVWCGQSFSAEPTKIDFDRQIRPILSNHCYRCHGPDAGERKGEFRLDVRDSALGKAESGATPIVPRNAAMSEVIARIGSTDADTIMPPPSLNKPLSQEQRDLLARWIDEGATYAQHWAFVPPQRAPLPPVTNKAWPRNAIDHFVLARLEKEGIAPSPPAKDYALLRRVTLDLTGLPPTREELRAFMDDKSPLAYENAVDRLLDSPRYGERMAVDWLDAARFADTHGFHIDSGRDMTRWREWVIEAFNRNLPFDQFTIDQLAGDLLPNATLEQKVASGFNRNHMINFEGGAIPQEYLNAYIVDRVNTTSTVWLGLTLACTQCHDHKYDPFTQKEFYQLYAFFHNVPENGLDGSKGNAAPMLKAPTMAQQREMDSLQAKVREIEQQLATAGTEVDEEQAAWERTALSEEQVAWTVLDPISMRAKGGGTLTKRDDKMLIVTGDNPAADRYFITAEIDQRTITAIRLETGVDEKLPGNGPGRSANGNSVLTDIKVTTSAVDSPKAITEQKFSAAFADYSQQEYPIVNAIDGDPRSGWAIFPEVGKPHAAIFELAQPLQSAGPLRITIELRFDSQFGQHQLGIFRLAATGAKDPRRANKLPEAIARALAVESGKRSPEQLAAIKRHFREQVSTRLTGLRNSLLAAKNRLGEIDKQIPTTMVMQELPQPRKTHVLMRGQYDKLGDEVKADVPAALLPLAKDMPRNRLGLAMWLVDKQHPLTARVIVNRYWQLVFGTGLVKTVEDLGSQGELPSHPELLDYLAVEFLSPERKDASGKPIGAWDVKQLLRLMVTSSTYRQAASVTPQMVALDPENRLLAHGPRHRLQAEFIRDQALFVSGLLNPQIGGKSVSPYQPPGLWSELASRQDGKNWTAQEYEQSTGEDLYRRTMYTFWKRTSPPPQLSTFDAPDRETCTVRRLRTNTPLQALILLNDPTYIEASRKLAERMMKEGGNSPRSRIAFAFELATARQPSEREQVILLGVFEKQRTKCQADPKLAEKLLAVGDSPHDEKLSASDLAAYALVASVILNLDETVTK